MLFLAQCRPATPAPATPESQLPPATQTGAHTFGCLLNGQPWTPSSNYGVANYRLIYDPAYAGGDLEVRIYRLNQTVNQYFLINSTQINKAGSYYLNGITSGIYYSTGVKGPCYEYNNSAGAATQGQLIITKLDLAAGIVSGTFAFRLWQPGCDTVKVTAGRFDYKL